MYNYASANLTSRHLTFDPFICVRCTWINLDRQSTLSERSQSDRSLTPVRRYGVSIIEQCWIRCVTKNDRFDVCGIHWRVHIYIFDIRHLTFRTMLNARRAIHVDIVTLSSWRQDVRATLCTDIACQPDGKTWNKIDSHCHSGVRCLRFALADLTVFAVINHLKYANR